MLSFKASLAFIFSAALVTVPAMAISSTHKSASAKTPAAHKSSARSGRRLSAKSKARSHKLHGQQVIDSNRVTEIQQALIREHYLTGDATGNWDDTTRAAMQKYQSDHGWQTRLMPDSRALKKLGLGPDYSGAINAEGASFASPAPPSGIPSSQAEGFAEASGVNE